MYASDNNFSGSFCLLAFTRTLGQKVNELFDWPDVCIISILALSSMVALFAERELLHCSVSEVRLNPRLNDSVLINPVFPVSNCCMELEISVFRDIFSVLQKFILAISGLNRNRCILGLARYSRIIIRHRWA